MKRGHSPPRAKGPSRAGAPGGGGSLQPATPAFSSPCPRPRVTVVAAGELVGQASEAGLHAPRGRARQASVQATEEGSLKPPWRQLLSERRTGRGKGAPCTCGAVGQLSREGGSPGGCHLDATGKQRPLTPSTPQDPAAAETEPRQLGRWALHGARQDGSGLGAGRRPLSGRRPSLGTSRAAESATRAAPESSASGSADGGLFAREKPSFSPPPRVLVIIKNTRVVNVNVLSY